MEQNIAAASFFSEASAEDQNQSSSPLLNESPPQDMTQPESESGALPGMSDLRTE